ncbi:arsenical pump-driving ATPase [Peptococcaceae bacterium CEB3]|nr:arsenical pump-driving ATPase [Peptococcaceae bacterium CEB3]
MSNTKMLIISGKGGVGKTTIAASTATAAAIRGYRTLVVSLDRAHSLGDVLQYRLGSLPINVPGLAHLEAMEIDPQSELNSNRAILKTYFRRLLAYLGMDGVEAEEMSIFPGLEELLVLTRLSELVDNGGYDLIVADMAPTASSLRYLSFPDMMEGVLGKLVKWDQRMANLVRPFQGNLLKIPVPEDEVYDNFRELARSLGGLRKLLTNSARTAVRLVMTPENIVLEETRRTFAYLSLFGLMVDSVIINRILPEEATRGYLHVWGKIQEQVLALAREGFAGLPMQTVHFRPTEVLGVQQLRQTAVELYDKNDPADFQATDPPLSYQKEGDITIMALHLPNIAGDSLDLRRRNQDLIITVGGWRRVILLPDFLAGYSVGKARLSEGYLKISFRPQPSQKAESI